MMDSIADLSSVPALIVMAHAAAQESVTLLAPYYLLSGCPVVGLDWSDSPIDCWPQCFAFCGPSLPAQPGFLNVNRITQALEYVTKFKSAIITEYDSLILKPAPEDPPDGILYTFIAGYRPPQWGVGEGPFIHPPFWATGPTFKALSDAANELLKQGRIGNNTSDVFLADCCDYARVGIVQPPGIWSCNGLDMRVASKLLMARTEAMDGAWHIHGVKRQDHLDFILGQTNQFPADTYWE